MKSSRRTDSESLRRDSRDLSHNVNRFRKRPSMLSEFHGSKHYNHRDLDRDGSEASHFRGPYHRHSNDSSSGGGGGGGGSGPVDRYASPSSSSSGFYKTKNDPRAGRHPYHHHNYRSSSSSHHFHSSNAHYHGDGGFEEDVPAKRPRLSVDVNRRAPSQFDTPNSADSAASSSNFTGDSVTPTGAHQSPALSPLQGSGVGGLSAYLEDIDSEDDDSLLRDEEEDKLSSATAKSFPMTNATDSATPNHQGLPPAPPIIPHNQSASMSTLSTSPKSSLPSKEELLQMMEKVDRDISATETQIVALQKKQAELEESAKMQRSSAVSPPLSTPSPFHTSPVTPSLDGRDSRLSGPLEEEQDDDEELVGTPVMSPSVGDQQLSLKRSLCGVIYAENKSKARSAQMALGSLHFPPLPALGVIPLYHQPSEVPDYHRTILNHCKFRPMLVEYIRRRKLQRHQSELKLCERYDALSVEWEKRVNRMENSHKKRIRDAKNRELFEKCFPELKHRREQQERFTRVDQRGFGVVRSDADLSELAIELLEQEEASVRYHKTHASIPPMVINKREESVRFYSSNGLIADPMAVYRKTRLINVWSDEEKRIFREKYLLYPKNFEMISSFLPNKSAAECVKYYYLSKKSENFKQIVRKANFKRKKTYFKQQTDLQPSSTSLLSATPSLSRPHPFLEEKMKLVSHSVSEPSATPPARAEPAYGEWSEEEIESLKEGLRKYGRAWGKVYREVGGGKTATQCKQFYDELCNDEKLKLFQALAEHSKLKNAEKLRRKAENRKAVVSTVMAEAKKKAQKQASKPQASLLHNQLNVDSENTESGSESETNSDESESESTITDSSPEDGSSSTKSSANPEQDRTNQRGRKSSSNYRSSEDALDLFISAAEVLNNIVPPEVALHDHSYARAPDSIMSEYQGTTGLSLIAAAAAVVSPSLTRNAGSGKNPSVSPVRAPRGRPPNSQRRGGSNSTSKLSPSLLSPAGSSTIVPLNDNKTSAFRSRARSAPTDRPKSSMLHLPRPSSNLTRMSLSSTSRTTTANRSGIMPPASYSKQRGESPSLKSMIALNPQSNSSNGTSAFEALVNAAAAASPAELPKTSSSSSHSLPSLHVGHTTAKTSAHSTPTTPINARPQSARTTTTKDSQTSTSSNASNTPTTTYFDVHQTINILVSLAQQNLIPANSTSSGSHPISLFAQTPVITGLGAIVTQANSSKQESTSTSSESSSSLAKAKVNTLLGHLTSGTTGNGGAKSARSTSGSVSSKSETVLNSGSKNFSLNSNSNSSNDHSKNTSTGSPTVASTLAQTLGISSNADDLSNLDLLSNLVAAVAATQSTSVNASNSNSSNTTTISCPPLVSASCATQGETTTANVTTTISSSSSSSSSMQTSPSSLTTPISEHNRQQQSTLPNSSTCNSSSVDLCSPASAVGANGRSQSSPSSAFDSMTSSTIENRTGISGNLSSEIYPSSASTSVVQNTCSNSSSNHQLKSEASSDLLSSSSAETFSMSVDDLPRSVTRTSSAALARGEMSQPRHFHNSHNSSPYHHQPNSGHSKKDNNGSTATTSGGGNDMTASLASIIPAFNPQQSSLLLYTRSLSFPMPSSVEPSLADEEEEDHLESATRGISELSKLLGTDTGTDSTTSSSSNSSKHGSSMVYKGRTAWNPVSDLLSTNVPSTLSNSVTQTFSKHAPGEFNSVPMEADTTSSGGGAPTKFSGLLESQIHGTVHHNPVPSPGVVAHSSTSTPNNRNSSNETTALDFDHSR